MLFQRTEQCPRDLVLSRLAIPFIYAVLSEPKKPPSYLNLRFIIYQKYRCMSYVYVQNILFLNEISFACRVFKIKLCELSV